MAAYNKFNIFAADLIRGIHDFDAHSCKVALWTTAPVATNSVLADVGGGSGQVTGANGYTTGGTVVSGLTITTISTTGGKLATANNIVWTAGGGTIPNIRYPVFYNDTPTSPADPLIAWWDYGSAITLQIGETFTWDPDDSNGIFTIGP